MCFSLKIQSCFSWLTPLKTCCWILLCSGKCLKCHEDILPWLKKCWGKLRWLAVLRSSGTGLGEMMDGSAPSPCCRAQHVISASLPLLWASKESVAGMEEAVLLPRTLCCLSLPCPLSLPANQACLPCKAVLCNLAWEMRVVMLHFFAAIKGCLTTVC